MIIEIENVGKVYLEEIFSNKLFLISGVHAAERGKGHGRTIMQAAIDWADKNSISLELLCQPMGKLYGKNRVMNEAELVKFYSKFGFISSSKCETFMKRAAA